MSPNLNHANLDFDFDRAIALDDARDERKEAESSATTRLEGDRNAALPTHGSRE